MYEAVHVDPADPQDLERVLETAERYGFEGIVIRNHSDSRLEYDLESTIEATETTLDVVDGLEVRADDPHQASGSIGNFRPTYTILGVDGGSSALNRFAADNDKIDVLAHPMDGSGDVNHVIVKAAAENGVRLECSFAPVLRSTGGRRVRAIQSLRKLRELVTYYDAPYVVSADPTSALELRAPRELRALGVELGFEAAWIEGGLEEWGRLATRNRRIQSDSFIEPGVKRGQYETKR